MIYNIFGSEDSRDIDVLVFERALSSTETCKWLCKTYEDQLSIYPYNKSIDVNLAVVENGVIVDCHKGTADEVNNMLYYTYDRHIQAHSRQVDRPVERNVHVKVARALRGVLSHLSRTEYRPQVKAALKSHDAGIMMECLEMMLESGFDWAVSKNNSDSDLFAKTLGFQTGQTVGLFQSQEFYSKSSISAHYPLIRPLLYGGYNKNDLDSTLVLLLHSIRMNYSNGNYSEIKE